MALSGTSSSAPASTVSASSMSSPPARSKPSPPSANGSTSSRHRPRSRISESTEYPPIRWRSTGMSRRLAGLPPSAGRARERPHRLSVVGQKNPLPEDREGGRDKEVMKSIDPGLRHAEVHRELVVVLVVYSDQIAVVTPRLYGVASRRRRPIVHAIGAAGCSQRHRSSRT